MSLINFLGLEQEYGNFAKGILYVVCEILWKIIYAAGQLVDVIVGLFYKLVGANYLGSGSETLVEEQDLLSKLFNENIISGLSLAMMVISGSLMVIFGVSAVIKKMVSNKGDNKAMLDVYKNILLGFTFLVCLTPVSMFVMSSINTITTAIVGIFGDTSTVSLADLMFNSSFGGDLIEAYNGYYGLTEETAITSWTQIKENFLFDFNYGQVAGTEETAQLVSQVEFYWYIYLIGGGIILFNLISIVLKLVKRIFMVLVLYITAPIYIARMADDGGVKFKEWKNKMLEELVSVVGTVVAFMLLISLVGVISELELVSVMNEAQTGEELLEGTMQVNTTAIIINNLAKMVLLMAGTSVAKDSGELLGNVFKGANDDSKELLEGIFNKVGKEKTPVKVESAPRTRVITKNTTSTRRIINYTESIPVSSSPRHEGKTTNVNNNNQRNIFNANVTNIDKRINNIQNRASVNLSDKNSLNDVGARVGGYKDNSKFSAKEILNQGVFNSYKQEADRMRNEWNLIKGNNSESSREVVKQFESASKELDSSIASGEQNKIRNSMNKYVEAYRQEEKAAKEGYKEFAGKSTQLTNDLSQKQQDELKKITTSYRKAQVEYSKTARRLSMVSEGNMSTTEALRAKERADKQRAKLMDASSRASNFYNKYKKGE